MMKHVRKIGLIVFLLLPFTWLLLAAPGCSQQQLTKADQVFSQGKQLGDKLHQAAQDPLVPDAVAAGLELGGVALLGAYGLWQKVRASKLLERHEQVTQSNRDLSTMVDQTHATLAAVADGIDLAGARADQVKAMIEQVMKERHIYDSADRIVDGARKSKSFR